MKIKPQHLPLFILSNGACIIKDCFPNAALRVPLKHYLPYKAQMVVLEMQLQIHIILQDLLRHPSKNDAGALRETGDNRYCCMKV